MWCHVPLSSLCSAPTHVRHLTCLQYSVSATCPNLIKVVERRCQKKMDDAGRSCSQWTIEVDSTRRWIVGGWWKGKLNCKLGNLVQGLLMHRLWLNGALMKYRELIRWVAFTSWQVWKWEYVHSTKRVHGFAQYRLRLDLNHKIYWTNYFGLGWIFRMIGQDHNPWTPFLDWLRENEVDQLVFYWIFF